MKRVFFIETQKYPEFVGGAEIFDYYLLQSLNISIPVSYLAHNQWSNFNAEYHNIPKVKPEILFTPFFIFIHLLIHRNEIACIHIRYSRSKWFNYWPYLVIKTLFRIPYVITIHGGGLTKWYFHSFYKALFTKAYKVIGISNIICREYKNRVGINVSYTPPLIPFEVSKKTKKHTREKLHINKDAAVFLIVGSLKSLKNPLTVLKAIGKINDNLKRKEKVQFIFVGDGPLYEDMQTLINKNNLEQIIKLAGSIDRDKINEFYKVADNYIISSNYEGTPIAMLEAMYNGLGIIGADVKGINTIIKNGSNGLLFNVTDSEGLKKKIELLLEDLDLSDQLGKNAKIYYDKNYNYKNVLDFYSTIFSSIN